MLNSLKLAVVVPLNVRRCESNLRDRQAFFDNLRKTQVEKKLRFLRKNSGIFVEKIQISAIFQINLLNKL